MAEKRPSEPVYLFKCGQILYSHDVGIRLFFLLHVDGGRADECSDRIAAWDSALDFIGANRFYCAQRLGEGNSCKEVSRPFARRTWTTPSSCWTAVSGVRMASEILAASPLYDTAS